jgi:hypothetical protein
MHNAEVEVRGTPPSLEQQVCDELLCEQYWHKGELVEAANVIYLRFGPDWHRLTFDHGIIFWRLQRERLCPDTMPELESETRIDNIGEHYDLSGRRLLSYRASAITGGSEVVFSFEGSRAVTFRNVADHTIFLF